MPVSRNRKHKKRKRGSGGIKPPKTKLVATIEKEWYEDIGRRQLYEKIFGKEMVDAEPERFRHLIFRPKIGPTNKSN